MTQFSQRRLLCIGVLSFTLAPCWGCGSYSPSTKASPPTITTTSVAAGNQGASYSATITASGGTAPYAWSVTTGSLPSGLSLGSGTTNSVTISGTPTAQGTSSFTIQVKDYAGLTATQMLSLTVGPPLPLAITTMSLPGGMFNAAYNQTLQATGGIQPYTWSITTGSLPAGLMLSSGGVISGTPTATGTSTFTVQVTDAATPTAMAVTANLSIVVTPTPLSITTASLVAGIVNSAYNATLQATGGVPPYTWRITGGSLPAGLMLNSSTGAITGTPTTTGTSTFTVQVADSEAPAVMVTANLSITINSAGSNANLSGNYAFLFNGWKSGGLYVVAGDFFADGLGNISNGLADVNAAASPPTLNQSFTGTYSIAADNLGTVMLTLGGGVTLAIAVQANGDAKVIEFDDTTGTGTRGSGVFRKQDTTAFSTAKITGPYALGLVGVDNAGKRKALAGVFQADGAGNISNGLLDANDNGNLLSNTTFTGTYSVANTGRGTATFNITGQGAANSSFYVVSATELLAMNIDSVPAGNSLLSGSVLQQTGAGSFTNASLNGPSIVGTTALVSGLFQIDVGAALFDGASTLTYSFDRNYDGIFTTGSSTFTYAVATNGRVTLTGLSGVPVFYLVTQNKGFIVGTDVNVLSGFFENQSGGPFSNTSLSGTYAGGSVTPVDSTVSDEVDELVVSSVGYFKVTSDSSNSGGLTQNLMIFGAYSVGVNGGVSARIGKNTAAVFYMVSPTKFVGFGTVTKPGLLIFEK